MCYTGFMFVLVSSGLKTYVTLPITIHEACTSVI